MQCNYDGYHSYLSYEVLFSIWPHHLWGVFVFIVGIELKFTIPTQKKSQTDPKKLKNRTKNQSKIKIYILHFEYPKTDLN